MDVYVDSDFLGLCGKEKRTDPDNARSRAGYVVMLNGCPVVWKSKLIDSMCLSTMMAEHCALSMSLREVLPLRDLVECMSIWSGLGSSVTTNFKVLCWEDNEGAWTLANLDPSRTTYTSL